ncbi:ABC transporter permease [uncultured Adlercreutzia sp.]|uniref:ABC transporter permease n=1 Tax=uncultured Adlercreutzia sp. TaxID=875803 RepID=UPI002674534B|nr:ABC transporter permease [uncultured Adlercreutzia sp.]
MGTLFVSTLRALLRERGLFIWSLAFPMLMATIFMFMFAGIEDATAFDPVPTAVVADEAWDASPFSEVVEALAEPGDDQLLEVRAFGDSQEALRALTGGEVMGVFAVDGGDVELTLSPGLQIGASTSADDVDRTILESVATAYVRDADLMAFLAMTDPALLADPDRVAAAFDGEDATEEVSLTRSAPAQTVRFYYALFAMAALFGAQIAVFAICWTQPNLSPLGARRALGAIGRTRTLAATLGACWLVSFGCLVVAFLYTRLVVGVDFAGREGWCVAGLAAAALLACALGTALGTLPKIDLGSKTGILTGLVCLLSLFTGLYGEPCMELADLVAREFPVLASLNPAKAICDMFYSLYYYDGLEVFAANVAEIGVFAAVLFAVGALFMRRQRYASL